MLQSQLVFLLENTSERGQVFGLKLGKNLETLPLLEGVNLEALPISEGYVAFQSLLLFGKEINQQMKVYLIYNGKGTKTPYL